MNILMVVPHLRKGGVISVVHNICEQIVRHRENHLYVMTLRRETANTCIGDFKKLGAPVIQLNFSYLQCEFHTSLVSAKVQEFVDKNKIDIIHSHEYHPALVCSLLTNVKKIATLHNRANEDYINVYGKLAGRYMVHRYFSSLKKYDVCVAVSESAAKMYHTFLPNIEQVNNGINTERFCPVIEADRITLKKKIGLPSDSVLICSTGRIEKEKRYEDLIRWFARKEINPSLYLLVLGSGRRLHKCQKIVGQYNNIILPGKVSNVEEYLQCSDYYISYSVSEGMSMSVCEGISCGLFPILSDIPSHHDVADNINGVFFNRPEEINISEILKRNIDKAYLHEYITRFFSIYTMGDAYLNVYTRLLEFKG